VLQRSAEKLFEPLRIIDMKWVACNTSFLLLLASRRRGSEFYAIDIRVLWKENKSEVWLWPVKQITPKILSTAEAGERCSPIKIPTLTDMIRPPRQEQNSCLGPLRALRYYIKRTEQTSVSATMRMLEKVLHRNKEASWVKKQIQMAYNNFTQDQQTRQY